MQTIDVTLPMHTCRIHIGPGLLAQLGSITAGVAPHERAMLAVDDALTGEAIAHGREAKAALEGAGYSVLVHEIAADEKRKTLETVRAMYAAMLAERLDRASPVVALGGGVVGDVAGFAAATYLRGVPLVQAPTTLLAMVDASIGGKTGVNFPLPSEPGRPPRLGKNLVGAFWQPRAIVADTLTLGTLEDRDFRCGLAESVKHGVLGDGDLFAFIESNADRLLGLEEPFLTESITRSARVKVSCVEADEREASVRALLNLGHTFAHVIEPIADLDLGHGEAVAIGLCAAAFCAVETGRLPAEDAARISGLLERLGLPTRLPRAADAGDLIDAMGYDKKVDRGRMRLVLPTALGKAEVVSDATAAIVAEAWRSVGAAVEPAGHDARG